MGRVALLGAPRRQVRPVGLGCGQQDQVAAHRRSSPSVVWAAGLRPHPVDGVTLPYSTPGRHLSRRELPDPPRWAHGHPRESRTARPHRGPGGRSHLVTAYFDLEPDPDDVSQQVAFGTSGPRGMSPKTSSTRCTSPRPPGDLRLPQGAGDHGPPSSAATPDALSQRRGPRPARCSSPTMSPGRRRPRRVHPDPRRQPRDHPREPGTYDRRGSRRRHRGHAVAEPAEDGGFKYNPPHGGPADSTRPA